MSGSGISESAAKISAAETRALMRSPLAPSAGGPGSLLMDRGRKVVGITGEVSELDHARKCQIIVNTDEF